MSWVDTNDQSLCVIIEYAARYDGRTLSTSGLLGTSRNGHRSKYDKTSASQCRILPHTSTLNLSVREVRRAPMGQMRTRRDANLEG